MKAIKFEGLSFFLCLIILFSISSCSCGDDDDSGDEDDDAAGDDDDDDDNDDDDDDNDNDDDDNDDDVTPPDPTEFADVETELVDGGAPGYYRVSLAKNPSGDLVATAQKGRLMMVYSPEEKQTQIIHDSVEMPSLAIDSTGAYHVSFADRETREITYGTNSSGSWEFEIIGPTTVYIDEAYSTVIVDGNDRPHICYYSIEQHRSGEIRYAAKNAGTWINEMAILLEHFDDWPFSDIALDSSGNVHISAFEEYFLEGEYSSNVRLLYATNQSGSWESTIIDDPGYAGQDNAIGLDSHDFVHIGYTDNTNLQIKHATNGTGTWVIDVVDTAAVMLDGMDMVLDATGHVHMAYEHANDIIRYASNQTGTWVNEQVIENEAEISNAFGMSMAIAENGEGIFQIAYHNAIDGTLWLATPDGGTWETSELDDSGRISYITDSSLKVDSLGALHVLYMKEYPYQISYAENVSGSWDLQLVDQNAGIYQYFKDFDLEVDESGTSHVGYILSTNYQLSLKYATNESGSWISELADGQYSDGDIMKMAIDDTGLAHMSRTFSPSRDECCGNLRYTTNASGSWVSETVDVPGDCMIGHAIETDSAGNPLVAYVEYNDGIFVLGTGQAGEWTYEQLEDPRLAFSTIGSLIMDSEGHLHATADTGTNIMYLNNIEGQWELEVVTDEFWGVGDVKMALDAFDRPVIAYGGEDEENYNFAGLKVALKDQGTWYAGLITDPWNYIGNPALAINSEGRAFAIYQGDRAVWVTGFALYE